MCSPISGRSKRFHSILFILRERMGRRRREEEAAAKILDDVWRKERGTFSSELGPFNVNFAHFEEDYEHVRFREAQGQEGQESSDSAVENSGPNGDQCKGGGLCGRGMVNRSHGEGVRHVRGIVHAEADSQDHIDPRDGVNCRVAPVVKEAHHICQGHGNAEETAQANLQVDQS